MLVASWQFKSEKSNQTCTEIIYSGKEHPKAQTRQTKQQNLE